MAREFKNHAYIDANNLYKGINSLGWRLDFKRFRRFLQDRHAVKKAYIFIGFIAANAGLYRDLQNWGYTVIFKPTVPGYKGKVKGNCDGELILQVMADFASDSSDPCEKAVIVTGDGDFACLINYLEPRSRLEILLSPVEAQCSILLKKATPKVTYLEQMKGKLELILPKLSEQK
ncbi:MAG: NYN domain-containing protein [Candidatus Liptonbacteria bacterium]|nr:NYN domain-containing protein [Candidatus Liptonbacteria bacterium]